MSNKELLQQNNSKYASLIELLRNKAINGGGSILLQEKTITPSTSSQNVTPDSGYDGLSKVTVNAMPTATQATPSISVNSSGLITASSTQSAGYVTSGTKSATKQLTTQSAKTITPSTSSQTAVASGRYTTGAVTVTAIPSSYVQPSGTKTITANGTYDIKSYASANVNVASSGGGQDMLQARVDSNNSCDYLFYSYKGDNVNYITNLDLSRVTSMQYMFDSCTELTTIPILNTSNVTNMSAMFRSCISLTTVPNLDTSNVTNMSAMFASCISLTTISNLDTSNVTNMLGMFHSCHSLTTVSNLDTSNVTNMNSMFNNCASLTTVPNLDTSSVTMMDNMFESCTRLTTVPNLDTSSVTMMSSMFRYCTSLTTIPELDTSKVKNMNSMFQGCSNLKSILMTGMKVNFDISASTKFARTDLVTILNNLATVTSSQKLTMGSVNLAKLTAADKAIATNKGWTLA